MMKFYFRVLTILLVLPVVSFSQDISTEISGKIIDKDTKKPVEFATVIAINPTTKATIVGTTSDENGEFSLVSNESEFNVVVSFIGYLSETFVQPKKSNNKVTLNNIALVSDSKVLEEVVVRAELSQTEFKLDKRVFNVGKDLSNTGASALEVLNNVPSVTVSIEGAISLRGSQGVQILINGKPSVLADQAGNALGTITADMIEKIEVITNPSAKYEAEGTSGIINIVLKKEEKKGINGSVSLNTGVPNNHSLGFSLNRRTEKFNLFSQIGVGRRTYPSDDESENRDLVNNTQVMSVGQSNKNETFYNFILGTDYHINDLNVLTLSGNFAYEIEDENSVSDFELFDQNTLSKGFTRSELTTATNPKWQYELQYKKDFEDNKEHALLFSAIGNYFGKDQGMNFKNLTTLGDDLNTEQRALTNFSRADYTFKLDYTQPFENKFTIETGSQYAINNVTNDFSNADLLDGIWVENVAQSNVFEWNQKVLGIYSTGAYEGEKWGLKLGLRLENTDLNTLLRTTNENNDKNYTNLFPSAHTSYKISQNFSLQAGYSKRIFRPRLWDLNPFYNIRNSFNVRTGNPNLQPEFTDSYELNSIFDYGSTSLNFAVFHSHTDDVVEQVVTFQNNISLSQPVNVGTNNTFGTELNLKMIPAKWVTINENFNFNYFQRDGSFENTSFDFNGQQWSNRITAKFKLPADIDIEVGNNYQSGFRTFQRDISPAYYFDLGARKKIVKGKAILNLSIRDLFATRISESIAAQDSFYLRNFSQRGRFITFGVSFGFGKGEAMEFSGQRRHR
ncbi:Outer membrane receptor proteins, mostly Fe transport [Spirosomataceae bacterium TFI 002]|nr:Outer membrane receptor proteins, mostly Fe transport [Spirosomataceae bacterium TFI 002]